MSEQFFAAWGLQPVELSDQDRLAPYFASLREPLSDYTFSQLFTWRNSLRIVWRELAGHLCIFANGTGDLTLLMPPIGDTGSDRALDQAFELMDAYNADKGVPDRSRVEYASDELLARFDRARLNIRPMRGDYVYDTQRMIDLAGSDLSSKRQARNRFLRLYNYRVEPYARALHAEDCRALLEQWKVHQDAQHLDEPDSAAIKRSKESIATALCLDHAEELGLRGMVVYVDDPTLPGAPAGTHPTLRGFTFGEVLGDQQSSITIEKTDLQIKGLAQFIFAEFCRANWSQRPFVNVGDDWGLESLAWTKASYRPIKMLAKHVLRREPVVAVAVNPALIPKAGAAVVDATAETSTCEMSATSSYGAASDGAPRAHEALTPVQIRRATSDDLDAAAALERASFQHSGFSRRQLAYLRKRDSAVFLVCEKDGRVIGDGIALVRQQRTSASGRIYSLAVSTEARGQKIGRKLLDALITALTERGVRRIYLEVEPTNAAALHLYTGAGFEQIGRLPDYHGPGIDAIHMMLDLKEAPTAPERAKPEFSDVRLAPAQ